MTLAVPIVAGTAIKGLAARFLMNRVLKRHPNAFLITLASLGVTIPLHRSQQHIAADIRSNLMQQGRPPDSPVVMVGHSQGGLACLRYALDHPQQVLHVITVGVPWHGSRSAGAHASLVGSTGRKLAPAIADMAVVIMMERILNWLFRRIIIIVVRIKFEVAAK